jgi:hypothetical protein
MDLLRADELQSRLDARGAEIFETVADIRGLTEDRSAVEPIGCRAIVRAAG